MRCLFFLLAFIPLSLFIPISNPWFYNSNTYHCCLLKLCLVKICQRAELFILGNLGCNRLTLSKNLSSLTYYPILEIRSEGCMTLLCSSGGFSTFLFHHGDFLVAIFDQAGAQIYVLLLCNFIRWKRFLFNDPFGRLLL